MGKVEFVKWLIVMIDVTVVIILLLAIGSIIVEWQNNGLQRCIAEAAARGEECVMWT